ncbi:MAG: ATP-binding cassette domain-containing protein [Burkholderiales bacterium]|nr:ATP-binding cassette domain-containing protein [Burkholderiales bacterium]
MLRITSLTLARGAKRLIENANLTIFPGHKVGLVGPNGCGKSTLFALLRGKMHQDAGDIYLPEKWVIAHVAQETPQSHRTALDYAMDGDVELRSVEKELLDAETNHVAGEIIAELHVHYDHIGGYAAKSRAAALLSGLGFNAERQEQPVATFSGGWRMRLNLAQALMCRSDLLLLDEPTNHLDLDAVMWLEDWLESYTGTLLLITHDRDFLDNVVKIVVHLDNKKLNEYTGNYSAFERARAAQFALQSSAFAKQQKQIAHLHSFIDRFKAKATKAKQAQSRVKTLERMELIAAAHIDSPFEFSFREPDAKPRQLIHLKEADLGYENKTILEKVEWRLFYGDKIGLLGPNGAGKSTLVKSLAGTLALQSGGRYEGQGLKIGYFAQHQVEQLRTQESPLQHMKRLDPGTREQEFRNFLGGFDFRGQQADASIAPFSGGEKARLALALIVWQKPNLLLLDEPTNHLDIEMREAVAEALQDFDGTLVVVAHDRHLLKATTDQLWLVADGTVAEFDGDLDDYKQWAKEYVKKQQAQQRRGSQAKSVPVAAPVLEVAAKPKPETPPADRKDQKRQQAASRQSVANARKPLEQKLAKLETEMKTLTTERDNIVQWLATEDAYLEDNKPRLQEMLKRQGEVVTQLADVEWKWFEVQQKLEEGVT